eukprot:1179178-Prorocentrum_minimum.AAC.1
MSYLIIGPRADRPVGDPISGCIVCIKILQDLARWTGVFSLPPPHGLVMQDPARQSCRIAPRGPRPLSHVIELADNLLGGGIILLPHRLQDSAPN